MFQREGAASLQELGDIPAFVDGIVEVMEEKQDEMEKIVRYNYNCAITKHNINNIMNSIVDTARKQIVKAIVQEKLPEDAVEVIKWEQK